MIPVKDTLKIVKHSGFDDWGKPTTPIEEIIKCRIDYRTEIVKDKTGSDVVSKATILILGNYNVTYEDTLKWTDEFGNVHEQKAVSISPIKDFSSKVLFTKVVV